MSGFEVALIGAGMAAETAAMVGTALTVASVAMTAAGTIAAGRAASANAKNQAAMFERTATQQIARGKWEHAQGGLKRDVAVRNKIRLLSQARAKRAMGGFSADDHSSSIEIKNMERFGTMNAFNLERMAQGAEWDAGNLAAGSRFQAASARAASRDKSYLLQAGGTLIGGVGKAFGSYDPGKGGVMEQSSIGIRKKTSDGVGTPLFG